MKHSLADLETQSPELAKIRETARLTGANARTVTLKRGSEITPRSVDWLWPEWLPTGKLAILAGAPGTGKTTLALSLAATLTRAGQWPDGTECAKTGNVIIWSGEDSADDSLVPRFIAAGGDTGRVFFIQGISEGGKSVAFDPALDIHELNKAIAEIGGVSLLIIDPIVSVVTGDLHRANDVRRSLQAVVDFAAAHGCAVLGITHFAKDSKGRIPSERVLGSQAFSALARTVLVAAKADDADSRVLARAKSNIGPDDGGVAYSVESATIEGGIEATYIAWGEVIEGSACAILGSVEQPERNAHGLVAAAEFLQELLSAGAVPTKQIETMSAKEGFSWPTMRRAKERIGATVKRVGFQKNAGWGWQLPPKVLTNPVVAHSEQLSTYEESEHLRDEPTLVSVEAAL